MEFIMIFYVLIIAVIGLILFTAVQIKLVGMNIKDFCSFIKANQILDKLYIFSREYEKMTTQDQLVFLIEAEKVFKAFEKIPTMIWEEEYPKYSKVLDTYKDIKVLRWVSSN